MPSDAAPDLDTEVGWQRHCEAGERAARKLFGNAALRQIKRRHSDIAALGVGVGGLVALGEMLRGTCEPHGLRVMEDVALAYLRGAIRGTDGPVNPDGTPYTGSRLDG